MKDEDEVVVDLMIDGCSIGVKTISRYLNQYKEMFLILKYFKYKK